MNNLFFGYNIIANKSNSFFNEIASNVAANIPFTSVKPEDYLIETNFNFELGAVTPDEIIDTVQGTFKVKYLDI